MIATLQIAPHWSKGYYRAAVARIALEQWPQAAVLLRRSAELEPAAASAGGNKVRGP